MRTRRGTQKCTSVRMPEKRLAVARLESDLVMGQRMDQGCFSSASQFVTSVSVLDGWLAS